MSDSPDLTTKQSQLIHSFPAGSNELAQELGCTRSSVRDMVSSVREKGINVQYDAKAKVYHLVDEEKVRRVSSKHTGTKTREANQWVTEQEKTILRRLQSKEPLVADQRTRKSNEDIVVHMTDTHMGDVVENDRGREVFNPEICEDLIEHFTQKVLNITDLMGSVTDFDTCHLVWGGDMITNENIYDGQAFDIRMMLADQLSTVVDALVQQAKSLADEFDTVQVIAQPGNHGKTRASGVSKQANCDLLAYRWIDDRLRESRYENIGFTTSEATFYRNFEVRDGQWRGHVRHGQDSLQHVDATASSSRDWRGWYHEHDFDFALRGHYHEARDETVMNGPRVIESPSMKPGDEFASRIGRPDVSGTRSLGTVFGSSDKRPMTWKYVIDDVDYRS